MTDPPPQPAGVAWPTDGWPVAEPGPDVDGVRLGALLGDAFGDATTGASGDATTGALGQSLAVSVIHHGRLVAERYGGGTTADTPLLSWSMAKSITHAWPGCSSDGGCWPSGTGPTSPSGRTPPIPATPSPSTSCCA